MKKDLLTCLLLVIISCASHLIWISKISILTSGDWSFLNVPTLRQFFSLPNLWQTNSLGVPNFTSSFYPIELMMGALSVISLDFGLIERIVFMWPIVFLLPISSYILLRKIFKNNIAVFVGSIVYSYNTYFLVLQAGHLTLMVAYSLAPLVIYFFIRSLEKQKFLEALIAGLLLFIVSFYEFRVFYILSIVLLVYYFFNLFVENHKSKLDYFKKTILLLIPLGIALFLNLYWIIGLSSIGALSTNPIFDRILFGNEYLNLFHAFTLHHPFWTGGKSSIFILQKIPLHFWIIPIVAILGLTLNRKNKYVLFFSLICLIGLFLTKQVANPFTSVYPFLFEYFPGFNAFREASKFFFLIALGYSVLIAAFVNWLWTNSWKNKNIQIFSKYFFTILISLIFIINITPLVTGSFKTLFVSRTMPGEYIQLNKFIENQNEFYRSLWIPTKSRWGTYSITHPAMNAIDAINSEWNSQIKIYRNEYVSEGELIRHLMIQPTSKNLLSQTSVKYVIVPLEDLVNEDIFINNYGREREYYVNLLDKADFLKKVNIGTSDVLVYENSKYKPKFYSTLVPENIKRDSKFERVNYRFINPSRYEINLANVNNPIYLNFTDNYHPKWMIFPENFKWHNLILKKENPLSNLPHEKNSAGVNSFYIDPVLVCSKVECVNNPLGGKDIRLTVYFAPQSSMYFGILVSLIVLLIIFSALIFVFLSYIYGKKIK